MNNQYRLHDALYGMSNKGANITYSKTKTLPDHFGYTNNTNLGSHYSTPKYLFMDGLSRIYYPSIYPEFPERWRYNEADLDMIELDKTISKFYSNPSIDIYILYPL
jgi:hypothetical protein